MESCRSFNVLGTSAQYWERDETQLGLQGGNIVILQANVKWRKFPGCMLKNSKLNLPSDETLVSFLERFCGVEVSFCTGISRRVRLRHMMVDLFPIFTEASTRMRDNALWEELFEQHNIIDNFRNWKVSEWLKTPHRDDHY
ncbi:MAPK-activated protein kinase Srk1 [Madurella fahalii]|uniref:MAPK-activated protein kinase Srk1 n=1 Tax=Madurella fahalii TaxID=1157608 RepID=A0ABQ0GHH6_9PEZI